MAIVEKAKAALRSSVVIFAAGIIIIAALMFELAKLGAFRALIHSRWFPEIVVGLALVVVLLIIFVVLPWYREYSFVQRLGSGYGAGGEKSPEEFQAKFTAALRQLRNLPRHASGGDSTYALPWFLIIGTRAAGKTAAIKGSGIFSPLTATIAGEETRNWDWWVSNTMLLVDTAGRYTLPSDVDRDRAEWYRLLRLIKHYHGREPLNGLVVTLATDYLASRPNEELRADGDQVRMRVEEAIQELGAEFPVYILVSKCDLLEGFAEFFATLPIRIRNQAVGWVDDPPAGIAGGPPRGTAAFRRLQEGIRLTSDRFSVLGTSVLNGNVAEELRQSLFCFPEEFRALGGRLLVFAEVLCSEDVRYHTPLMRGIFVSSAPVTGPRRSFLRSQVEIESPPMESGVEIPPSYFLKELFETILPRDRALACLATSKVYA
jgi:type VI secretion system protein ImpL